MNISVVASSRFSVRLAAALTLTALGFSNSLAAGPDEASPSASASPSAPEATPALPTEVTVNINEGKVINEVTKLFHGSNFVSLWNSSGDSPATVKAYSQTGMGLIRFPGGTTCHWYDWEYPYPPRMRGNWRDTSAWNLAKATGGALVLQTNTANGKNKNEFNNDAEHQAGWVDYAKAHGFKVAFWEIGNEPEMDAPGEFKGNNDRLMAWTNSTYEKQAKAILAKDPKARLLGYVGTNVYQWWALHNLERFLSAHGNWKKGTGLADGIALHWYLWGGTHDWKQVRSSPQTWEKDMDYVDAAIQAYDSRDLPVYITEWNFAGGMANDHSVELFQSALGNADCVGMMLRTGVKGHNYFCMQGPDAGGWGMLSMKGGKLGDAITFPTYYGLTMAAKLTGKVLETKSSVDEGNVLSAYAAQDEDNVMHVMLINKSENTVTTKLAFSSFHPKGKKVSIYRLEPANGNPKDLDEIYNGVKDPKPSVDTLPEPEKTKSPANFSVQMKPYSMVVVNFEDATPITAKYQRKIISEEVKKKLGVGRFTEPVSMKPRTSKVPPVAVPYNTDAIKVDCDESAWKDIKPMPEPFMKSDAGSLKLTWREDGLYGFATVKDDAIKVNKESPWKGDGIELFVEKDAAGSPDRTNVTAQYAFSPDPDAGAGKGNVVVAYGGQADKPENIECQWKPVDGGYVLEFLIPADMLKPATMADDSKIGLNFTIDKGGKSVEQFYSDKDSGDGFARPSTWGVIQLKK